MIPVLACPSVLCWAVMLRLQLRIVHFIRRGTAVVVIAGRWSCFLDQDPECQDLVVQVSFVMLGGIVFLIGSTQTKYGQDWRK